MLNSCSRIKWQVWAHTAHGKKKKKAISSWDKDVCIPLQAACKSDSLAYQFATVMDNQLTKFRISIWSWILYEGNVDICGTGRAASSGSRLWLLVVNERSLCFRTYSLNLMRELKSQSWILDMNFKELLHFFLLFFQPNRRNIEILITKTFVFIPAWEICFV